MSVTLLFGPRGVGCDWICDASCRDIDRQRVMKEVIGLRGEQYLPESCLLTVTFSLQKNYAGASRVARSERP
jgi:hypothetical protein